VVEAKTLQAGHASNLLRAAVAAGPSRGLVDVIAFLTCRRR
jgi:hypothetical protein